MKRLLMLVILLSAIFLTGCSNTATERDSFVQEEVMGTVTRFEDDTYEVICWQYDDYYGSGISCLPKSQVTRKPNL